MNLIFCNTRGITHFLYSKIAMEISTETKVEVISFKMAAALCSSENLRLLSKGLYRKVSNVVGAECIVNIRRQQHEMFDTFRNCEVSFPYERVLSGSIAEGFFVKSSDMDVIVIDRNAIVLSTGVHDLVHVSTSDFPTVFVMVTKMTQPGFTLLKCLRYDNNNREVNDSLVSRGSELYMSNKVKQNFYSAESTFDHGPCSSGELYFGMDYDLAYTLKCPNWPEQAMSFIHRSLLKGWPDPNLLASICKTGCLLVPINSKRQACSEMYEFEWRISFNLAERKLIFSMNHSQFLCYGLMKLFLNEILKKIPDIKELLCSYFMKTALFWEISEDRDDWLPRNFMFKFWNVFRRIIKWVSIGYCPNFFIPENNMFVTKIYGAPQRRLMSELRTLYNEGFRCLLRCSSLAEDFSLPIASPILSHHSSLNEDDYISQSRIEEEKLEVLCTTFDSTLDNVVVNILQSLFATASLIPTSDVMSQGLKQRIRFHIQRIAFLIYLAPVKSGKEFKSNRRRYEYIRASQSLFRKGKTVLFMSEINHAVCAYLTGQYNKTIEIGSHIVQRLKRQPYMYRWDLDTILIMECRQKGMTYEAIIQKYVLDTFDYESNISIDELYFESHAYKQSHGGETIHIPPLVFVYFLMFLSNTRLKNERHLIHDALRALQNLSMRDQGCHIHPIHNAIYREILGICQQICGDYHGAYQSYVNALNDEYNHFERATLIRITILVYLCLRRR